MLNQNNLIRIEDIPIHGVSDSEMPEILSETGWSLVNKHPRTEINTLDPEITAACDHGCEHCWADLTGKHMDLETFRRMLDFAQATGVQTLQFTGGEPTLNPHFAEMAKEAKERGFELILRTHGRTMRPDYFDSSPALRRREDQTPIAETVAKYFDEVIISIDGTAEENFAMRPAGKTTAKLSKEITAAYAQKQFDETIGGLRALNEAAQLQQGEGPTIMINTVVAQKNYQGMADFGSFLQQLKEEGVDIKRWDLTQVMRSFITTKFGADPDAYMISEEQFHQAVIDAGKAAPTLDIRAKGITTARCYIIASDGDVYVGGSDRVEIGKVGDVERHPEMAKALQTYHTDKNLADQRGASYLEREGEQQVIH